MKLKWTTIEYFKQHSRICGDGEDALLEQYGVAAENHVLKTIRRTYDNVIDIYGEVPADFYVLVQLLVDSMYQNRSMVSMQNLSIVPYSFDFIIKNYIRLAGGSPLQEERDTLIMKLDALEVDFTFSVRDVPDTDDIKGIKAQFGRLRELYGNIVNPTQLICSSLRKSLNTLTEACKPYLYPDETTNP